MRSDWVEFDENLKNWRQRGCGVQKLCNKAFRLSGLPV